MITLAEKHENGHTLINATVKINHPLIDTISVALGSRQYSNFPKSVELAFFKNDEWVTEVIPEFAEYADGLAGSTLVYGWVPLMKFAKFMEEYTSKK